LPFRDGGRLAGSADSVARLRYSVPAEGGLSGVWGRMADLEHLLGGLAAGLQLLLEGAALIAVVCGLVAAAGCALSIARSRSPTAFVDLRLRFGSWLALALEFQLGADIVATTVRPTTDALIQLGVVAVIRTFLNYFLGRELAEQTKQKQEIAATQAAP
jgi:uncharacterized membrane protein